MSIERDKYLTVKMGNCWHERKDFSDDGYGTYSCKHCNERKDFAYSNLNPNFSTWEGFGKLWTWSKKQLWWKYIDKKGLLIHVEHVDPDVFADLVHAVLKSLENYWMELEGISP